MRAFVCIVVVFLAALLWANPTTCQTRLRYFKEGKPREQAREKYCKPMHGWWRSING